MNPPPGGTGSGAKRSSSNSSTDEDTTNAGQIEAARKRRRLANREIDSGVDEAKSNSLGGSDYASATASLRESQLRLAASASSYMGGGRPSLLQREREQIEHNNRLIGQNLQYPTNDQLASLLRGPMQFPGIDPRRFATNPSRSQLLDNFARSELSVANLLARQNGMAGLAQAQAQARGSSMIHHPLLQPPQDTTQQQLEMLSSLSAGRYTGTLGASGFLMPTGGGSLSNIGLLNPLQGTMAGANIALPRDEGGNQITLPFARRNPRASAIETASSSGTTTSLSTSAISSRIVQLPPIDEGLTVHHSQRTFVPLGIDEDNNWLSELHCLVRLELVEVFRAGRQEVVSRSANKRISYLQVGVRCRFCAHLPSNLRAARSSAFPSSIRQIYQSFTMMLRDHFGQCSALPTHHKTKFLELKTSASQGASHSKHYWNYSAMKVGLVDTESGIVVTESTQAAGKLEPPFGSNAGQATASAQTSLVSPEDRAVVNDFIFSLMSQACMVHLLPSEQIGNRKSLRKAMPGFGCRSCARVGWLGLSRMFPARRRTLRSKLDDLYTHVKRCSLCPQEMKTLLETREGQRTEGDTEGEKLFFDQVWARLGHENASGTT